MSPDRGLLDIILGDDLDDDPVWKLVQNYSKRVHPPWRALRLLYLHHSESIIDPLSSVWGSLTTAEELGWVKRISLVRWRLTVKGYKIAERLWGELSSRSLGYGGDW